MKLASVISAAIAAKVRIQPLFDDIVSSWIELRLRDCSVRGPKPRNDRLDGYL